MGKKNNKLENEYSRLSGMSQEEIDTEKVKLQSELAQIDIKIHGLTEKVTTLSIEINTVDEANAQKNAKVELKTKLEEEIQKAGEDKEKARKALERIEGFSKNKLAIQRIIQYRNKFIAQRTPLQEEKAKNEQEIKAKEQEIENIDNDKDNTMKKIEAELHLISSKTREEYTTEDFKRESMLSAQRDEIKARREKLQNEKTKLVKDNQEIDKKIETINIAISKCNLAWKSLLNNKTWEQIQARSLDGRYTRDKDKEAQEKAEANKVEEKEKLANEAVVTVPEAEKAVVPEEIDENMNLDNETLPDKPSKFRTFLAAMRHPIQSIKTFINNRKAASAEKDSKEEKAEQGPEQQVDSKKEETKPEQSIESQRDAFLSQLQKMAESDRTTDDSKAVQKAIARNERKVEQSKEDGPEK